MFVTCTVNNDDIIIYRERLPLFFWIIAFLVVLLLLFYFLDRNELPSYLNISVFMSVFVIQVGIIFILARRGGQAVDRYLMKANKRGLAVAPLHPKQVHNYNWVDIDKILLVKTFIYESVGEHITTSNQALIYIQGPARTSSEFFFTGISRSPTNDAYYAIDLPSINLETLKETMDALLEKCVEIQVLDTLRYDKKL